MRFSVFAMVKVWKHVWWVVVLCSLVGGYSILEEHVAPIFRIENGDEIIEILNEAAS
jgi:hypothetical protein